MTLPTSLADGVSVSTAFAGLLAILLLIAALITKELVGFIDGERARRLDRALGAVVVPLVVAVAAVVLHRVL